MKPKDIHRGDKIKGYEKFVVERVYRDVDMFFRPIYVVIFDTGLEITFKPDEDVAVEREA